MSLGYALAGAVGGAGDYIMKEAERVKKQAEQDRQEKREDRLRADNRSYNESMRDEDRAYDATRRSDTASADVGVMSSVYGQGGEFSATPGTIGDLLLKTESGGSFDTLFGHSQRTGGKFDGVKVSEMTIGELNDFTNVSGEYGQWVKGQVGVVATPMGAGQIVGTTLRSTAKALGLSPETKFTPEVQMQMVDHLARQAISGPKSMEGKRQALRGVWEGFKKVPDSALDKAILAYEGGDIGISFGDPNREIFEAASNPNTSSAARTLAVTELERRQRGSDSVKLTGEEWIEQDGVEVLMGRDDKGNMIPYTSPQGKPFTRDPESKKKPQSLSASLSTRIDDWAFQNGLDDKTTRKFKLKTEEFMTDGLTETAAWDATLAIANKGEDQSVTSGGIFGIGERTRVTPGTYDGTFTDEAESGGGLGPATTRTAQATPEVPREPAGPGTIPSPKSKSEYDAIPSGQKYIDPEGNTRVKP